jgi:hypothetical protein
MQLYQQQQDIVKSSARFKVCRAGRRSGKSTVAIEIMLFAAVSKKNRNVFYISPNMKQSRAIIWEALKTRLNGIGKLNESRLEVELPTTDGGVSRIFLSGFEARENFRGLRADLIIFDEVDTCTDFFIGFQEIFRPALIDTMGSVLFIGTPKKESRNLFRLEKIAQTDKDYACFHFTSLDNPFLLQEEKTKAKQELDFTTYQQEILAEYIDNAGSLFKYDALVDVFSNTIVKEASKYLIVDIADDGSDKTIFSFWEGLEEYRREEFERLNTEMIINKIREYASQDRIPFSHIAVDAIGVGAGVASSSMLDGIIGYKSSYSPIKTDMDIVRLPNQGTFRDANFVSDYKNLRSQCIFELARLVNEHLIASRVTGRQKEVIIEELANYQDVSVGDGRRSATPKETVKEIIGRSPDSSDCWIMRQYFTIRQQMLPDQGIANPVINKQRERFLMNKNNGIMNSTK